MKCPICKSRLLVLNTRDLKDCIARQRNCLNCDRRFESFERYCPDDDEPVSRPARGTGSKRRRLKDHEIATIRYCLKFGISTDRIAKAFNVHHATILYQAKESNRKIEPQNRCKECDQVDADYLFRGLQMR